VITVRKAAAIDLGAVTDVLQQAFYEDPVIGYLFPSERSRRWRLAKLWQTELTTHYLPLHSVWTTEDFSGAALWAPPKHWSVPLGDVIRHIPAWSRTFGRRVPRALRFLSTVERVHPAEPHWYLHAVGTAPRMQGKGVATALLEPVLARCDDEGVPAYLESSNERNIPLYARHGFKVTGEIRLANGPLMWPMWREPRG